MCSQVDGSRHSFVVQRFDTVTWRKILILLPAFAGLPELWREKRILVVESKNGIMWEVTKDTFNALGGKKYRHPIKAYVVKDCLQETVKWNEITYIWCADVIRRQRRRGNEKAGVHSNADVAGVMWLMTKACSYIHPGEEMKWERDRLY